MGFVTRNGTQLLLYGAPYRFIGINNYALANASFGNCCDGCGGGTVAAKLDSLLALGCNVVRFWAFQLFAGSAGTTKNFSTFDTIFAACKARGMKAIPVLENVWADCTSGGYHNEAWYTTGYQSPYGSYGLSYIDYVEQMATRYRDQDAILMWQLINEMEIKVVENGGCGSATTAINFVTDMANRIKTIDRNHLVSVGTIGSGQCGTSQTSTQYQNLHNLTNVDICEVHDLGISANMAGFYTTRLNDANAITRPIFAGENGTNAVTGQARADRVNTQLQQTMNAGYAGWLLWMYGGTGCGGFDSWCVADGDPTMTTLGSNTPRFNIRRDLGQCVTVDMP